MLLLMLMMMECHPLFHIGLSKLEQYQFRVDDGEDDDGDDGEDGRITFDRAGHGVQHQRGVRRVEVPISGPLRALVRLLQVNSTHTH